MVTWEKKHPSVPEVQPADRKFPLEDPHWNNNPADRRKMGCRLRNTIIKGIRESVPDPKTKPKSLTYKGRMREGPADFLHMRKYSGLNSDDPLGQGVLKLHFVINSWQDITKK
jgi:hypothetical protein